MTHVLTNYILDVRYSIYSDIICSILSDNLFDPMAFYLYIQQGPEKSGCVEEAGERMKTTRRKLKEEKEKTRKTGMPLNI